MRRDSGLGQVGAAQATSRGHSSLTTHGARVCTDVPARGSVDVRVRARQASRSWTPTAKQLQGSAPSSCGRQTAFGATSRDLGLYLKNHLPLKG